MIRVDYPRVFHPSGGPMLTKQSEKDLTDVNLIMDSWIHAGAAVAGHLNAAEGAYGDFSSGIDYHAALDAVRESERVFAALPPKVRDYVDNDPGKLLDLVFDPERRDELVELGLVAREEPDGAVGAPGGDAGAGPVAPLKSTRTDDPGDAGGGDQKSADPAAGLFD